MRGFAFIVLALAALVALAVPDAPAIPDAAADPAATIVAPPSAPAASATYGSVSFDRGPGGHFWTEARIEGRPVRFLVDTGATGVVLTEADASRAGIYVNRNDYEIVGTQVAGTVRGKRVLLREVRVGHKRVTDVEAVVIEGATISLLGQSFLTRAGTVEMQGDRMTLR